MTTNPVLGPAFCSLCGRSGLAVELREVGCCRFLAWACDHCEVSGRVFNGLAGPEESCELDWIAALLLRTDDGHRRVDGESAHLWTVEKLGALRQTLREERLPGREDRPQLH